MSKGFKIAMSIIGIVVAGFIVLAVLAYNSSSTATTPTAEVDSHERAVLVTIIQQYTEKHLPGVTLPDITTDDWTYYHDQDTGLYNITTVDAQKDGSSYEITAWIELSGDTDYTIHYLNTTDGTLIDDGTVKD